MEQKMTPADHAKIWRKVADTFHAMNPLHAELEAMKMVMERYPEYGNSMMSRQYTESDRITWNVTDQIASAFYSVAHAYEQSVKEQEGRD